MKIDGYMVLRKIQKSGMIVQESKILSEKEHAENHMRISESCANGDSFSVLSCNLE